MKAIIAGTIFSIGQGILANHTILIRDGIIEALDPGGNVPPGYEPVDASGHVVLPGLIDARTSAGLSGEGDGFQNADHEEAIDPDTAWVRAIDALNPADLAFADARRAGVTSVLSGPGTSNAASGLSAVVKTAGGTADAMLVREPAGLHFCLGWPPVNAYRAKHKVWTRMGVVALLRERLTAARVYLRKQERTPSDPEQVPERDYRLEPYAGLLRGAYPARIRVATAEDAWTALRLADEFGFDLALEQLTEGHLAGLPEELARRGVPCVLGPMMKAGRTPETKKQTFRTAAILAEAGVELALCTGHPSRPVRHLVLEAALAVRAGLDEATALRAITLNAAKALGLEDSLGSLESGKQADLVIFDGDPFLPETHVVQTYIAGQVVYRAGG